MQPDPSPSIPALTPNHKEKERNPFPWQGCDTREGLKKKDGGHTQKDNNDAAGTLSPPPLFSFVTPTGPLEGKVDS